MRRSIVLALGVLVACLWAVPVRAQISCTDANFDAIGAQVSATPAGLIPTNIAVGDLLIVATAERDGGSTINAIAGNVSGTWDLGNLISAGTGSGGDSRWYYKISTAAGSDTITITYSASVTSRMVVGRCTVTGTTPVLNVVDTTPAASAGSTTSHTSDSVTPSASGLAIGFLALGGDETLSAVGSGETDVTNESNAAHILTEAATTGVGTTFGTVTTSGARASAFHIVVFAQPAANLCGGLGLMGVGCAPTALLPDPSDAPRVARRGGQ